MLLTDIKPGQIWQQTDSEGMALVLEYDALDASKSSRISFGDFIFIVKVEEPKLIDFGYGDKVWGRYVTFLHEERLWSKVFKEDIWDTYFTLVQESDQ